MNEGIIPTLGRPVSSKRRKRAALGTGKRMRGIRNPILLVAVLVVLLASTGIALA